LLQHSYEVHGVGALLTLLWFRLLLWLLQMLLQLLLLLLLMLLLLLALRLLRLLLSGRRLWKLRHQGPLRQRQ